MKTTLTILSAFIWSLLPCLAFPPHLMVVAKKVSAPAPDWYLSQTFEGTGAETGWTDSGTVDWDESVIVGSGAQSLELAVAADTSYTVDSSADYHMVFKFRTR